MSTDDKRIERIEDKLDEVARSIASIDKTLAGQHVSLKHHIRRTDLLEKKIEPIERHVAMIHGGLKVLGAVVVLIGVIETVLAIVTHLKAVK